MEGKMKKQKAAIEKLMPPMKPMVHFSEKELKEIKHWKLGATYNLHAKVKMVSIDQHAGSPMHASFEVLSVSAKGGAKEPMKPKGEKDEEDDEDEEDEA